MKTKKNGACKVGYLNYYKRQVKKGCDKEDCLRNDWHIDIFLSLAAMNMTAKK